MNLVLGMQASSSGCGPSCGSALARRLLSLEALGRVLRYSLCALRSERWAPSSSGLASTTSLSWQMMGSSTREGTWPNMDQSLVLVEGVAEASSGTSGAGRSCLGRSGGGGVRYISEPLGNSSLDKDLHRASITAFEPPMQEPPDV